MEGFGRFGAFAGGQTAALKAHRKPLLWPWPWGACLRSGLGPGVPVGEVALALGCLLGKVFGGFGRFCRVWRVLEGVWRVWKVLEGLEGLEGFGGCLEGFGGCLEGLDGFGVFGVFAGWQTAALKANRKPLLWPWPWGACLRSGLGPGVPVGEGVWRVWKVLEGLEGLEGFGRFGAFAGGQTAALKAHRKPLLWPWPWGACWGSGLGPGVPAGEGVWRVWKVLEGLEGLEGFGRFGAFAGGQTAALKAHRKPLLWPWPWGACLRSGLGRGVPVGAVALALGCLLGKVFGGFGRFWRVWRVLEGVWRVWKVLEGLEGLEGFGGFWRVFGGFGGFWRVWRVLERLECLRAGKRQL